MDVAELLRTGLLEWAGDFACDTVLLVFLMLPPGSPQAMEWLHSLLPHTGLLSSKASDLRNLVQVAVQFVVVIVHDGVFFVWHITFLSGTLQK